MHECSARPGSAGEHALQDELGTTERADRFYRDQVRSSLNERMREFVAEQELVFIATADAQGECDCSLRAGPPGFVRVLGDQVLAFPDYRGNGVMASMGNARENAHIGLLFVDFQKSRVGLHVNGSVRIFSDLEMRARWDGLPVESVPGRRAVSWLEIGVEEAYIHCSKHIPRLAKVPTVARHWGTDDIRRKGGDWFGSAAQRKRQEQEEQEARQRRAAGWRGGGAAGRSGAPGDASAEVSRE
ncbi:pyridoxamine 5'-phosphate oxidase family protein [Phaeacidiphilus oryzae]|jgi:predicted pyridoxine 5'-phosphate oxidase superfamily flavin-nucleotide-binding protein|uniref:pyridoxamine 5'-phosphate oxidase family protein n=1 Tax=Phaeacidiphilus oryzae TaxID=348818 RepID=UPI0007C726ED|nr:pyridoxamine 5'-phosphate oxidase family protein [Phaeacidiphilus oryzae]